MDTTYYRIWMPAALVASEKEAIQEARQAAKPALGIRAFGQCRVEPVGVPRLKNEGSGYMVFFDDIPKPNG